MKKASILVVDDEEVMRDSCRQVLLRQGHDVSTSSDGAEGLRQLAERSFDILILDLKMPGLPGLEVLDRAKQASPETIVVIITGHATVSSAVEAMKLGAYDFLPKPFTPEELRAIINRALERRRLVSENFSLRGELQGLREGEFVMGPNAGVQRILGLIGKVAPTDSTALITGESGTGKELIAKAIHRSSPRKDGPFIAVDCGSLVPTLFESELFGHVKGAFTDAVSNKRGKLEMSDGGTIFFDEIGNISLESQAKLLRALQEREFCRVGETRNIPFDARIIAATNRDLRAAVEARTFRDDLYYRINVVNIVLPPLRDRRDDIPVLAEHFLKEYNRRRKRAVRGISGAAMRALVDYAWPGNIRELENVIERAVILCDGDAIEPGDFPFARREPVEPAAAALGGEGGGSLEEAEKAHILRVLERLGGNRSRAAQALGIDRKTLRAKIRRYGLEEADGD